MLVIGQASRLSSRLAELMSLTSVLQTAHSGMLAATTTLEVASNNLANARTPGFKSQSAVFATQAPTTITAGAAPTSSNGGSNPLQIGAGVRTIGTATDFSQGSIVSSADPLNLALEGDGFFIVEGAPGEVYFTRAGQFGLNAQREIVSSTGHRLLGFGVDDDFQVIEGQRQALSIPIGSAASQGSGGTSAATLTSFRVTENGRIEGRYSDGQQRNLGRIRIARFANSSGLEARGDNLLRQGVNSGAPIESYAASGGGASIVGGAVELSNTNVGANLVDLMVASQQFVANAEVFRTADGLLDELTQLRRHDA